MSLAFDPLFSIAIIVLQVANRYLKYDITKAQEKILMHPFTQFCMYFCIIYFTTKNIPLSLLIVLVSFLLLHVLLNENNKYNILPPSWLYKEHLINEEVVSQKEVYKQNINKYNS